MWDICEYTAQLMANRVQQSAGISNDAASQFSKHKLNK